MKTSWLTLRLGLLLTLLAVGPAHAGLATPRLVRVTLGPQLTAKDLARAGLDIVDVRPGMQAHILEWPGDAERLTRLGATFEVEDENPGRTAAMRAREEIASRPVPAPRRVPSTGPEGVTRTELLPPFGSGSMGGYWITSEIKAKLDDLVASDANDVVADQIQTIGVSRRGRPIWALKLGRSVTGTDTRPVAYFSALTHSREPGGMQALFYFVDDLLARYNTDPFAAYLLNQRQIYIVPLINPDGYAVNESIYVASGGTTFGLWRKNTRDNNANGVLDSNDGVDLNRNYGYQWGYDLNGSSTNPADDTYRGPSAFSEPETQVQRDFVVQIQPRTGFSFHTYSDLMLHPWGYAELKTLDDSSFREWSDQLTRENAYISGLSTHVLYPVNGEFNDWAYGDTLDKPRMFSWTPEVGSPNDDFWPPPSRIVPLSAENVRACYVLAAIAGPWVQEDGVTLIEGAMNAGHATQILVRARNVGSSGTAGPNLTGTMVPLDAGVSMLLDTVTYPNAASRQTVDPNSAFYVAVHDSVTPGRLMRFEVRFTDNAGLFSRDTIVVPVGTPTILFTEDFSPGLLRWTPDLSWGVVSNDPEHLSRYAADSPAGDYGTNWNNRLRLINPASFNLSAGVHAYATLQTRWEYEPDYDGAAIEASVNNGGTWTRLRGTGTTPGSGLTTIAQPLNQPVYAGSRRNWASELVDLSPFTGPSATAVQFRVRSMSDGGSEFDGFNFDSLRIMLYDPAAQPAPTAVGDGSPAAALELAPPTPNPARGRASFSFGVPRAGSVRLEILDLLGRRVRTLVDGSLAANHYVHGWDLRDEAGRLSPPGIYLARLSGAGAGPTVTRRFAVLQ